jgi:TfoX/Sxy family transcriptional regulator of competence genes
MAYDEGVAQRIRETFADRDDVVEKKMFGGIAFMVRGNMCVGVNGDDLMLRVGKARHAELVDRPHVRPMDFTGRTMDGFLYLEPEGYESDEDLAAWIGTALEFVLTLPAK